MKRLLPLLCLLIMSFPASAQEDTNPFPARAEWHEKWQNSLAYTLEALEKLPDSSFHFRPSPGQMSVLEQVQHISGNVYGLSRRFLGYQPADFDESNLREILSAEDLNRQQLTELLTNAYAFGTDAVNSLAPKDWDEIVPNFFAGPRSKRVIVYLLQDHATHHRAQVLMYLRMLELEPPRYRGW